MGRHTDLKHRKMRTLYEWQSGRCALCFSPMIHPDEMREAGRMADDDAPTVDHFKPRAKGGENAMWNLLLAHGGCNRARGSTGKLSKRTIEMMYAVRERIKVVGGYQTEERHRVSDHHP